MRKHWGMIPSFFFRIIFKIYYVLPRSYTVKKLWLLLRGGKDYPKFLIPYGAGGKILVEERDFVQRQILLNGFYEPEVWETVAKFIKEDDVVWDVGANIGSFAIRALQDKRVKRTYLFEPEPENLESLIENLSLNPGKYELHKTALSDSIAKMKIFGGVKGNCGRASLVEKEDAFTSSEVDCETIDNLIYNRQVERPDIMKLDVEGWELKVLKGGQRFLSENAPRLIVFEADADETSAEIKNLELKDFLMSKGYQISHIRRKNRKKIEPVENYAAVLKPLRETLRCENG